MENRYGRLLKEARERARRGVRETARACGISAPYLSRVENGLDPPMTTGRTVDVARYLKVDPVPLVAEAIAHRGEARLPVAGASRQRVEFAVLLETRWVDGSLAPSDIEALTKALGGER